MTIRTPTGTVRTITPGTRWRDGAWHWTGTETAETLAAHGYTVIPDPEPAPATLAELQAAALASVRMATATHILATYPDWYQRNCAMAVYPEAACQTCRDGIAACVGKSNRVEDLIAAAGDAAAIDAAVAALALPEIAR